MRRFVPCTVAAFTMLSVMLATPAHAQPILITIELTEYRLSPNQIDVAFGEEVQIHLINNGSEGHNFFLETYANYDPIIAPGRHANASFTADAVGTYLMYCMVSGHRGLGMEGTLTIRRVVATPPTPVLEVTGILAATSIAAVATVILLRPRRDSD